MAATKTALGYTVCTFGSPSWQIAGSRLQDGDWITLGGNERIRTLDAARRYAADAVGTGSCTDARVAVIYDADASPDISDPGGNGWEWV